MKKVIKASTQRRWVPFVFAAALLCSAWLPLSAFAAGEVVEIQNVNHIRSQGTRMSAQPAGGKFSADKAADGKDDSSDHDSRWSSGDDHPAKDKNTWLQATFAKPTSLSYFKIVFETRDAGAPPTPSNVKAFDIEYKTESGDWKLATTYTRTGDPLATGGYDAVVKVKLDAPIEAKAVRLTNFDVLNGSTAWNGVSVAEFEAYTNEQTVNETLESVVSKLNRMGDQTVAADVTQIEAPEVPTGFAIEFNGADFEQVIGKGGAVHHPLTDKIVQVSWKVSKEGIREQAITNDIAYEVKGTTAPAQGNARPTVVPEIQEWFSNSTDKLGLDALTGVTYGDASLKSVVDEFVADYKDFTGKTLAASQGAARAGAFNFTLGDPAGDKLLGEEGYAMQIQADRIDVTAPAITGNMYAMQTILQMTKTETDGFPVGEMRDYPRFPVRGFMWDIARKSISLEMVGNAARTMRYYKMNDLQLHLSDNLIFLESYGNNEADQWGAYSAFRLESGLSNNGVSPTAKDYNITKAAMRDFIKTQRDLGMNVVPEIDMPAHAVAFTRVWPELAVKNTKVTTSPAGKNRSAIDHLDVRKPEARKLIRDIFDDYTTGANPVFDTDTVVHVGADEFIIPNGRPSYCEFYNDLVPHLLDSGHTPRIWGSFDSTGLPAAVPSPRAVRASRWTSGPLVGPTPSACSIRASRSSTSWTTPTTWCPTAAATVAHTATTWIRRTFTTRSIPTSSATRCCLPAIRGSWAPALLSGTTTSTRMPAVCPRLTSTCASSTRCPSTPRTTGRPPARKKARAMRVMRTCTTSSRRPATPRA